MKKVYSLFGVLVLTFFFVGNSWATLFDRGNGLIFDDDLNITWLADANYAQTSGYDADGRMNWTDANIWADGLVFGGFDDWRLPTIVDTGSSGCNWASLGTDCGYNVDTTTSEMAHLFYDELGNLGYYDTFGNYQSGYGISNTGPFTNIQSYFYWSGTEYVPDPDKAWYFVFDNGDQGASYSIKVTKNDNFYAWAVRDGDLAAPVPEPSTILLLIPGLIGLILFRWKQGINLLMS